MKIYSWNVNGLRAAERKGFINWAEELDADIICIQEVRALEKQLSKKVKNIDEYKFFINPADKKGYSGTAVYYKREPERILTGLPDDKFNDEGRTIIMEYPQFILFNIYFPNGQQSDERLQYKLNFYEELLNYAKELVNEDKNVVICGDYNTAHTEIDLKNPKSNSDRSGFLPIERQWIDQYIENGFIDVWREKYPEKIKYSWWTYRFNARKNNAGWRIDYFLVSNNFLDNVENPAIHNDVFGSDHCPISLEIKLD